ENLRARAATSRPPREGGARLVRRAIPRARVAPAPTAQTNKQLRCAASPTNSPVWRNGSAPFLSNRASARRTLALIRRRSTRRAELPNHRRMPIYHANHGKYHAQTEWVATLAPGWFCLSAATHKKTEKNEKNHAEKAGTKF